MKRLWIAQTLSALFWFVLAASFAAKAREPELSYWTPTPREIAAFEAKLNDLPLPLTQYRRIYHGSDFQGDRVIHGQFAPLRSGEKPTARGIDHRPEPLKTGGCVISLSMKDLGHTIPHAYCAALGSWAPTKSEIEALERGLEMPPKAWPLSRYVRRYAGVTWKGHRLIEGSFQFADPTDDFGNRPGVIVESEAEFYLDGALGGGCSYVTLTYDPVARGTWQVMCNADR